MRVGLAPTEHRANHESLIYRLATLSSVPPAESVCLGSPLEARNTSRSPPRSAPATRSVPRPSRSRSARWRRMPIARGPERRSRSCYRAGARRSLHFARECSASREHGNSSRHNKQSSHLSTPSSFLTSQKDTHDAWKHQAVSQQRRAHEAREAAWQASRQMLNLKSLEVVTTRVKVALIRRRGVDSKSPLKWISVEPSSRAACDRRRSIVKRYTGAFVACTTAANMSREGAAAADGGEAIA